MDINLPGTNGIEAARKLRDWAETCGMPVVALSAAAMLTKRERNDASVFFCYLTKPIKLDELPATLEELFHSARDA